MKHVTIANLVHEFAQHLNEGKQSELIRGECAQLEAELVAHLERYVETYAAEYSAGRVKHEDVNWLIALKHIDTHPNLEVLQDPSAANTSKRAREIVDALRNIDAEEAAKRG